METNERFWKYDPSEGYFVTLFQLSGSVVPDVLGRAEFWLFLGIHIMVWAGYQSGLTIFGSTGGGLLSIGWSDIQMMTVASFFLLALYINQCYTRYLHIYSLTRKMFGLVHDFAYQARLFTRASNGQPHDRLACRWLAVVTVLSFVEIRGGGIISPDQWNRLVGLGLIKRDEVEFMKSLTSQQRLLVILHSAGDVATIPLAGLQDATLAQDLVGRILAYRETHQELLDTLDLPVPFQYYHMVTALTFANLFLLSFGLALTESSIAPCIFIVMAMTLMGMMELAVHLWNPFSGDWDHFPINRWLTECLRGLAAILDYVHDSSEERYSQELQEESRARTQLLLASTEVDYLLGTKAIDRRHLDALAAVADPLHAGYQHLRMKVESAEADYKALVQGEDDLQNEDEDYFQGRGALRSTATSGKGNSLFSAANIMLKGKLNTMKRVSRKTNVGRSSELQATAGEKGEGERFSLEAELRGLWSILAHPLHLLVLFVPFGMFAKSFGLSDATVFGINFLAIIPLASILGASTEALSEHTGQLLGGLLNATFGNAVEMIMCVQAVRSGLIRVVQGNLLGSVLSNLLLVLGMALAGAGMKFKDLEFNAHGAAANMTCQFVATISICLPTIFRAVEGTTDLEVLLLSRYCCLFLVVTYFLFLFFQLKTHSDLFSDVGNDEEEAEASDVSMLTATVMLAGTTVAVAMCSECLIDAIEGTSKGHGISQAFIGVILLPIVGNAAEHVTAVTAAMKGLIDLAIGIAVGSSTQVALFVVPCSVLWGWVFDNPMTLDFTPFDTACQLLAVILVQQVLQSGHANWLNGIMLMTTYLLIAVITLFIPR